MITQLRLARAADGMRATTGSGTEGGLTPRGEVMLVAKLFFNLSLPPFTRAHTHSQASICVCCLHVSQFSQVKQPKSDKNAHPLTYTKTR